MYELRPPAETLRPYIENYWFVSHAPHEAIDIRVDVFVDARADLVFNFEAPYLREIMGGDGLEIGHSNLDAQRLVPIRIHQRGSVRIAGVRFLLGGLAPFTSASLDAWSGRTPPPEQVLGPGIGAVEEALRLAPGPDAGARILDDFFLARLRIDDGQERFRRALSRLASSPGRSSVREMADVAGTTVRQLERLFARNLGFPPRTVARVVRFQYALRRLMADPGVSLGDLAAEAGYFDQAHFVREFRALSGGVPRGYRGYYPPDGPSDFAPNVVVFVQDAAADRSGD